MKGLKQILICSVCLAAGVAAGMGGMYGLQRKNIRFAKDNSLLMEVQEQLDDVGKELPDGMERDKAVAKGYLTQFDRFTYYKDNSEPAEEEQEVREDVEAEIMNGNVLYLKINGFLESTHISVQNKIEPLLPKAKSMIIDLRNNKGGVTTAENEISNMFLDSGIVNCYYYNGEEFSYKMRDTDDKIKLPTVILVNGNTASSSEIMTALFMQNHGDTTVVGTQTFGKGVFQDIRKLSNGDEIMIANGYYTVGDWECYNEVGITPDIVLEMDESLIGTFSDTQLKKALEILG